MINWARSLVLVAGLMGMAGVMIAAAGRHSGGGDLAGLAAQFLLIHAAVVWAIGLAVCLGLRPGKVWLSTASVLVVGVLVFAVDLSLIAFADARPMPLAAPMGGLLMIAGWFGIAASAVTATVTSDRKI